MSTSSLANCAISPRVKLPVESGMPGSGSLATTHLILLKEAHTLNFLSLTLTHTYINTQSRTLARSNTQVEAFVRVQLRTERITIMLPANLREVHVPSKHLDHISERPVDFNDFVSVSAVFVLLVLDHRHGGILREK